MEINFQLPKKLQWVFAKPSRYKGAYGGRGSGKSFNFAKALAIWGLKKKSRFLCCREFQNSIKDSVLPEIAKAIESDQYLNNFYKVGSSYIKGKNGTEFLFKGLRHNYREIKSTSNIDICWIEEAENVSQDSWIMLIPTIRNKGSEIWLTWNPESKDSATFERFILNPHKDSRIVKVNYSDNPWFPEELETERKNDMEFLPDLYHHIWEGEVRTRKDTQIFNGKWFVEEFEEPVNKAGEMICDGGPYYGSDFGFSQDPTTIVRCFINGGNLYISHEAGGKKIDIDDTKKLYSQVPGSDKYIIRADSARPETISYLKKQGLRMQATRKWAGSVEDGIAHMMSYKKIVIHPRCTETINEFRLYSYKVDKQTKDPLRSIVDAYNHYIDAIRYAIDPLIKSKQTVLDALKNRERR